MNIYHLTFHENEGGLDSITWNTIEKIGDFVSPWTNNGSPRIEFRALHTKKYFIFRFDVNHSFIEVQPQNKDERLVLESERVELFFKPKDNKKFYYCIEMDVSGRVYSYRAKFHHKFDYCYKWPLGYVVKSIKNDTGYSLTGALSFSMLNDFQVIENQVIRAGVFVGRKQHNYFEWITWVDPKLAEPDFHVPGAFGEFKLQNMH